MADNNDDTFEDVLAQTEEFIVWRSQEEGEYIYHLELGGITLHLLSDEWEELITLISYIQS